MTKTLKLFPTKGYEAPLQDHPGEHMRNLYGSVLQTVCDNILGRRAGAKDADRFKLLRYEDDYSRCGLMFDGVVQGELVGEFIWRDGGTYFRVTFNPANPSG